MTDEQQMIAWNNLVRNADLSKYTVPDARRAAAIVVTYMGTAINGGLHSFYSILMNWKPKRYLHFSKPLGPRQRLIHCELSWIGLAIL